MKTENRVGHSKGDYDVQTTFEGDNNVLMQQVRLMNIISDVVFPCFDYTMFLIGSYVEFR